MSESHTELFVGHSFNATYHLPTTGIQIILFKLILLRKKGNCTPNQKLARSVFYLTIINTFLKNNIYAYYS